MKITIGDKVKIIYSPYNSVKKGTITYVKDIKWEIFGKYWAIYILADLPCQTFKINEIEKMEEPT